MIRETVTESNCNHVIDISGLCNNMTEVISIKKSTAVDSHALTPSFHRHEVGSYPGPVFFSSGEAKLIARELQIKGAAPIRPKGVVDTTNGS